MVVDAEHPLGSDGLGFFLGQLAAPGNTALGGCALASVVILHVAGCLLTVLLPVVPSLGTYLAGQVAIHEEGVAIVAPGASQINLRNTFGSRDATVVEHVAVGHVLRGGGCCDVGVGLAEDVAMLEPGGGRTEDEVGGALDVAVLEQLA